MPATKGARCRVGDLLLASVAEKEMVMAHAQWSGPEMKARSDADYASPAAGVDAAMSARTAGDCPGPGIAGGTGKVARGVR